jgi:hypothetical protein
VFDHLTLGQSTYLDQNSHPVYGLEPMAIILSLPWALLMWSYVISRFPPRFTFMRPLLCGGKDGDLLHCAIVFLLQDLKPRDTHLSLDHVGPCGYSHHMVHPGRLGNYRR